MNQPPEKPSNL